MTTDLTSVHFLPVTMAVAVGVDDSSRKADGPKRSARSEALQPISAVLRSSDVPDDLSRQTDRRTDSQRETSRQHHDHCHGDKDRLTHTLSA